MRGGARLAADPPRKAELALRPARLDGVDDLLGVVAAQPGHDALPEGVGANGAGHQVRAVETEDRVRVLQDLNALLQDVAGRVRRVEAGVRADDALERYAVVRPGVTGEVAEHCGDLVALLERSDQLATTGDGLLSTGFCRRQQERVDV